MKEFPKSYGINRVAELLEENEHLKAENEQLKKQNKILFGQLVINDGEDVTVQISQSEFEEYNELKEENKRLKAENEELKEKVNSYICSPNCYKYRKSEKYKQALEEVREIASIIITEEQTQTYWTCYKKLSDIFEKINEVLKDE